MAKVVYAMKMVLYKYELEAQQINIFEDGQYEKLVKFVMFILHVYVKYWFECPLGANAPLNDLKLVQNCIHYRVVDTAVSAAAVHACSLHGWYLTQELVPLCLFDKRLSYQEKNRLAEKLQCFVPRNIFPTNRFGGAFGKPPFPNITFTTKLVELVGRDSAFFLLPWESTQTF